MKVFVLRKLDIVEGCDTVEEMLGLFATPDLAKASDLITDEDGDVVDHDARTWDDDFGASSFTLVDDWGNENPMFVIEPCDVIAA